MGFEIRVFRRPPGYGCRYVVGVMGVSYFYANLDKSQYFSCGLFGTNDKLSQLGFGYGSRALSILLLYDGSSWKGDRIVAVSDISPEFDELELNGINVEIEAELLLIDTDGLEWLEEQVKLSIVAFTQMCRYAWLLDRTDIAQMLDREFGKGNWQKKYEKHYQGNTDLWTDKVIEAKNRSLKLFP